MEEKFGWFPAFISKVKLAATQCSQFWWGAPWLTGTSSTQYRVLESQSPTLLTRPNYFLAPKPPEAQFWRFGFAWVLIGNHLYLLFGLLLIGLKLGQEGNFENVNDKDKYRWQKQRPGTGQAYSWSFILVCEKSHKSLAPYWRKNSSQSPGSP